MNSIIETIGVGAKISRKLENQNIIRTENHYKRKNVRRRLEIHIYVPIIVNISILYKCKKILY